MELDAVLLARIQFAFTITFHIIFPSFTIGLAAFIATLLVRWRITGQEHLHRLARFWTKIFAVSFAMGVVSGVVMSYEFGTNWSHFSVVVGNVIAPLIGYEVLTAFFLSTQQAKRGRMRAALEAKTRWPLSWNSMLYCLHVYSSRSPSHST